MQTDEPDALDHVRLEPEVIWAAGLFEGEGCLTISGGHPRMKLNSTDEDVVRRFHDAIGVGQIREENAQVSRGYKPQWEWYTASKSGIHTAIYLMWPWLGERRQKRAIELLSVYKD